MPRARNIKPSLFTNEILGTLDPMITLLFCGLWCLADKDGILEDRPLRIKAEVFPYRENVDVNGYLTVMSQHNFIQRYEVNGKKYIFVTEFLKHQRPHNTEVAKGYPKPQQRSSGEYALTPLTNGELTVPPRSDSLIPDSLIPDSNTLSGKPDVVLSNGKQKFKADALQILDFLNIKTGSRYRPVVANLELIAARLKEGATSDECRQVIAKKAREWKGTDMEGYLRPATLFNRTKFAQYQGELI